MYGSDGKHQRDGYFNLPMAKKRRDGKRKCQKRTEKESQSVDKNNNNCKNEST